MHDRRRLAHPLAALTAAVLCLGLSPTTGCQESEEPGITQIFAEPERWSGRTVTLEGRITTASFRFDPRRASAMSVIVSDMPCAEVACEGGEPCCPPCQGPPGLQVDGHLLGVTLVGDGFGCNAPECRESCAPADPGQRVRATGQLRLAGRGQRYFELHVTALTTLE